MSPIAGLPDVALYSLSALLGDLFIQELVKIIKNKNKTFKYV